LLGGDGGNEGISRESDEIVEKGPEAVDWEVVVASAGGFVVGRGLAAGGRQIRIIGPG